MAAQTAETDGRRARRDRNRAAVIDAMISLFLEEDGIPSTEQIAMRAGVSVSSVFRYFDNLEDLQQEAVQIHFERFGDLFEVPSIGSGPLADRLVRFVDARAHLHTTVAPIARRVRADLSTDTPLARQLASIRAAFASQVRSHFGQELDRHGRAVAEDLADSIDALTSFESWDLLRSAHGRSQRQIRRTWTTAIRALLTAK